MSFCTKSICRQKNPHSGLSPVQRSVHFMFKERRMAIISSLNHQLLDVVQYFHFIFVITFPEFFSVCLMISSSVSISPWTFSAAVHVY